MLCVCVCVDYYCETELQTKCRHLWAAMLQFVGTVFMGHDLFSIRLVDLAHV